MRCTRSRTCACFFLLSDLSFRLGDRGRYPPKPMHDAELASHELTKHVDVIRRASRPCLAGVLCEQERDCAEESRRTTTSHSRGTSGTSTCATTANRDTSITLGLLGSGSLLHSGDGVPGGIDRSERKTRFSPRVDPPSAVRGRITTSLVRNNYDPPPCNYFFITLAAIVATLVLTAIFMFMVFGLAGVQ